MKRRIANKLDHKIPFAKRNKLAAIYLALRYQEYWSVTVGRKCYFMTPDGRIMIYSEFDTQTMRTKKCSGYYFWHDEPQPDHVEYFT